jgi:hypothetical protein
MSKKAGTEVNIAKGNPRPPCLSPNPVNYVQSWGHLAFHQHKKNIKVKKNHPY